MGAYLTVKVEFRAMDKVPDIEEQMHKLYAEYGMKPVYIYAEDTITYEDACKANQKCFDELLDFDEWKQYRIEWRCDWLFSAIDTFPNINIIAPNYEDDKPYGIEKEEWILFPEDEIDEPTFNKILNFVADIYKLDFVCGVKIEKEY